MIQFLVLEGKSRTEIKSSLDTVFASYGDRQKGFTSFNVVARRFSMIYA